MLHWLQPIKNIYHYYQAHLWRLFYGRPDRSLTVYGITGTNGKTTTCYFLTSILAQQYGADKVGMLTTVAIRIGNRQEINKTKLTTLPSRLVYRYLRDMVASGVRQTVLELTSHALDQNRLAGLQLAGGIILNVEREHLDYHQTMEQYAAAKALIIKILKPNATLVGKADDQYVKKILEQARSAGLAVKEYTAVDAQTVSTPLFGAVNQENVLAATLLAQSLNISPENIKLAVVAVKQVPGRMEWIDTNKEFRVLIDYAVTPAALSRLYKDVRAQTSGRVLALLGAAGQRDRGKRPLMAKAVADIADLLVITREDPWTESEEQIFQDLEKGLIPNSGNWRRIVDRRDALLYLLKEAKPGDTVVVTGKGAEEGMGIGHKIIPWNDKQIIKELLLVL